MTTTFDTVKKIESLDELKQLSAGEELVIIAPSISHSRNRTVHGTFKRQKGEWVELSDYISIPVIISVDIVQPGEVLEFLRWFNDSRYERKKAPILYKVEIPSQTMEVYRI